MVLTSTHHINHTVAMAMRMNSIDPYDLLMELTERIQHLEKTNGELIRAINTNHQTLQSVLKNQQNMAEAHRELTNYVTATKPTSTNTA